MKVYTTFPGGRCKALTFSYDDGRMEDERLVKIFNENGIKGTFNLNAGYLGQGKRIGSERVKELYKGHEVATHAYTHATLTRCPAVEIAAEILKDRKELEDITGELIRGHAYPNGAYSEEVKAMLKSLGIAYGRVTFKLPDGLAGYYLPEDPLEWHPTCHHGAADLMEKGQWLINYKSKEHLRLMYVWGHSYEFTNDNSWEVIEDFCQLMGGHDDIWYATNIEIIDYMNVLKNLRFSADGTKVMNPSAQSAWLMVDMEKIVEIKGGSSVGLGQSVESL